MDSRGISRDPMDAHCGKPACYCGHAGGCYRGWVDYADADGNDRTQPCGACRDGLLARVRSVPPPGQRHHVRDQRKLRGEGGGA